MSDGEPTSDVVIVGGGLAGLTAATFLARGKRRVVLIEQSHTVGGRAYTKHQEGFSFNLGPHALYRSGPGISILRQLGVEVRGKIPTAAGGFAVKDGVKHTLPAGLVSLLSTSLLGLSAKLETARLLASLSKLETHALDSIPAREWVNRQTSSADVRDLLLSLVRLTTYANSPDLLSAGAAVEQLQKAFAKNVLYLDLGWQTLVDGLLDSALQEGVKIETNTRVESIELGLAGEIAGVRLDNGRFLNPPTVLIASNPASAVSLVKTTRSLSLERYAEQAIPVEAACLDLALNRLPDPRATFALGIDKPYYFSVHSAAARLAPDGRALIHIAKYLPGDHQDSAEDVQRELESFADLIQPGWRHKTVIRRFLPRMTVSNALPLASQGGLKGRPGPQVSEIPELYLAGDWIGNEGQLVDASLASAKRAAETILASAPHKSIDRRAALAHRS